MTLAALQILVSRLPLVPNKDVVFAGICVLLIGHDTRVVALTAQIASLVLIGHILVAARADRGLGAASSQRSRRMKIVEVCAFYAPQGGGVRAYIERKLLAGPDAGHEIVVIVPGKENKDEQIRPGSRMVTIASPPFPLDRRYRYFDDEPALHAALDAERPDVVEVSSQWRSCAMVADWQGDAKRVLFMHSDPLSAYLYRWFGPIAGPRGIDAYFDLYWRYLRRLSHRFDCIVSASASLSRRLTRGRRREGGHGADGRRAGHLLARRIATRNCAATCSRAAASGRTACCCSARAGSPPRRDGRW